MRKPNKKKATCHPDKPHYAKGLCGNCYAARLKKNNPEFAENQRSNTKNWYAAHPDYAKQYKKEEIARKGGASYQRKLDMKKLYGMTPEMYQEMFSAQNGCCAICKKPQPSTRGGKPRNLSVDHCHDSNVVRGLLCLSCNCGLGYFKDSLDLLKAAIEYLEKSALLISEKVEEDHGLPCDDGTTVTARSHRSAFRG